MESAALGLGPAFHALTIPPFDEDGLSSLRTTAIPMCVLVFAGKAVFSSLRQTPYGKN